MFRSKCYRVCLWFQAEDNSCKLLTYIIASGPAEQLLQRIQWLDARGGILRDLMQPRTNPFVDALKLYSGMVIDPLVTGASLILKQFHSQGVRVVQLAFQFFFVTTMSIASKVWLQKARLAGWPYRLVGLVMPQKDIRVETAKAKVRKICFFSSVFLLCCLCFV